MGLGFGGMAILAVDGGGRKLDPDGRGDLCGPARRAGLDEVMSLIGRAWSARASSGRPDLERKARGSSRRRRRPRAPAAVGSAKRAGAGPPWHAICQERADGWPAWPTSTGVQRWMAPLPWDGPVRQP